MSCKDPFWPCLVGTSTSNRSFRCGRQHFKSNLSRESDEWLDWIIWSLRGDYCEFSCVAFAHDVDRDYLFNSDHDHIKSKSWSVAYFHFTTIAFFFSPPTPPPPTIPPPIRTPDPHHQPRPKPRRSATSASTSKTGTSMRALGTELLANLPQLLQRAGVVVESTWGAAAEECGE